jgi:hypothetical protein
VLPGRIDTLIVKTFDEWPSTTARTILSSKFEALPQSYIRYENIYLQQAPANMAVTRSNLIVE